MPEQPGWHWPFPGSSPYDGCDMSRESVDSVLPAAVESLVASINAQPTLAKLGAAQLPSRAAIVEAVDILRQLTFPGYYGSQHLNSQNLQYRVGEQMVALAELLYEQVRCCLRYSKQLPPDAATGQCAECDRRASQVVRDFLLSLPNVRELLAGDVTAAFNADPAALGTDETIFCYPGLFAIFVQRMAHEFYKAEVPLLPRIMTEHAHSETGIDIHPGARLGRNLFIDHGTGVVIGQTTTIGDNVKIYQGVTLGALAPDRLVEQFRGRKRHPTIEDDVTIYAHATILGGDTVIGRGAVIGGNVFLTASVPANTQVSNENRKLAYRERKSGNVHDFQI